MAVVRAQRALMAVHASDAPTFLATLQSSGLVEPIEPDAWPIEEGELEAGQPLGESGFDLETEAGTLRRVLALLDAHAPVEGGLKSLFSPKPTLSLQGLTEGFRQFPLGEMDEKARSVEAELQRVSAEETRLGQVIEALEPWKGVDARLSDIDDLQSTGVVLAEGPTGAESRLWVLLGDARERAHTERLFRDKKRERFLLIFLKEDWGAVEAALREAGAGVFERPSQPSGLEAGRLDWDGTPSEVLEQLRGRLQALGEARAQTVDEVRKLAVFREPVQAAWDYVNLLKARKDAEGWLVRVGDIALAMGWVLENQKDRLRACLAKAVPHAHLDFLESDPEENLPVRLENAAGTKPFSVLTGLYGLPKPTERDPTPLLAPFFFVFYGLCLTDSGYGFVMAILFWMALRWVPLGQGGKNFFRLLLLGGVSALFFGVFVGGWFGNTLEFLPQGLRFLKRALDALVILDPIKNPVPFLIFSLILGVIQIYIGLFAKLRDMQQRVGWREALLSEGVEIFLLSGFLFWGLAGAGLFPATVAQVAKWTAVSAAIVTVAARGRSYRNLAAKVGGGLLSLYGLVNYLGDILSYSRLFALGLATGVIAVVVNTFAELLGQVPYLGVLIGPVIFVIGHFFNLLISGLGAFVHSARLQYVEFFSKFYEGGGRAFDPFRPAPRYVNLQT